VYVEHGSARTKVETPDALNIRRPTMTVSANLSTGKV
jgi:hypothetical protein